MAPSLSSRPRYTIPLVLLVLITVFLLFSSTPGIPDALSRPYPLAFRGKEPPLGYIQEQIRISEANYRKSLVERKELIRKWGPSPKQIDAFPSNGEFYTLWDFFTPAFQCPHRTRRIGILGDGGKWVCGYELIQPKKACVIYSVGINGESSFEAALLEEAPGCQVWGYDFSVNSMGPEIEEVPALKSRAHFKPYMLTGKDDHNANPPQYTLNTLMAQNGHKWIDLLKIDIEGSEFETLETLIDAYPGQLPFGQLQLEIHARVDGYQDFPNFLKWWEKLEAAGLRPFWTEPNLVYVNLVRGVRPDLAEYSFINIKGNHALVSDVSSD